MAVLGDPAHFDLLHPRDPHSGQFIDVLGAFEKMGGTWHEDLNVWQVPKSNRKELNSLLKKLGAKTMGVPHGMRVASDEDRTKFKVPPAWTSVYVTDDPDAQYKYIGVDAGGKPQQRRTLNEEQRAASKKYERVRRLTEKMPELAAALEADAMTSDTHAALLLMQRQGLRVGGLKEAREQAYGATTLQRRHVKVVGDKVTLDFIGKDAVHIVLNFEDPALAKVLKRRTQGKGGDDRIFDTNATQTNRLLQNLAPGHTNKDLRTFVGTSEAKLALTQMQPPVDAADAKKKRNLVGDRVSSVLGNTRAIALKDYIDPSVWGPDYDQHE